MSIAMDTLFVSITWKVGVSMRIVNGVLVYVLCVQVDI